MMSFSGVPQNDKAYTITQNMLSNKNTHSESSLKDKYWSTTEMSVFKSRFLKTLKIKKSRFPTQPPLIPLDGGEAIPYYC